MPKSTKPDTRVRLAVDVVELLGVWMESNGHTSPTAATNAALRQFLKGYTPTPVNTSPPATHATVRKLQQLAEPPSLLQSAFSELLGD